MAASRYVLFIDGDMERTDGTLLRRTVEMMKARRLHCATTNIWCSQGTLGDKLLYMCSNIVQYGSLLVKPFSTGMFMMFHRETFQSLGRFHDQALYTGDYLLSKKV